MGKKPIIDENLSQLELDDILKKNYGYGFSEFKTVLLLIMRGLWSKRKNAKIKADKKERNMLFRSLLNFEINIAPICPKSAVRRVEEAVARRIVVLDELTKNSHFKSQKIPKSHKIAAVWAQVMKKNGRRQWTEITNLLNWFNIREINTKEGTILKDEENSWSNPKDLTNSYFRIEKNYAETIEELKNLCFLVFRNGILQLSSDKYKHRP